MGLLDLEIDLNVPAIQLELWTKPDKCSNSTLYIRQKCALLGDSEAAGDYWHQISIDDSVRHPLILYQKILDAPSLRVLEFYLLLQRTPEKFLFIEYIIKIAYIIVEYKKEN